MAAVLTYAQNREDIYINWLLEGQERGFYVDIGANDPAVDSVTKFFYDRSWRGINIEPIQHHHKALQEARPLDINLNIGISTQTGSLPFREYVGADGLSTLSNDMKKEQGGTKYKTIDYMIPVLSLADVLKEHLPPKQRIDFLKIDVEGYEYDVIASNDWSKYHPRLVVVEANHVRQDWRPILHREGYTLMFFDGVNEYYGDKTLAKRKQTIIDVYPRMVIGPLFLNINQQHHMEWVESTARREERSLLRAEFSRELQTYQTRIDDLQSELAYWRTISVPAFSVHKLKTAHVRIRRALMQRSIPSTSTKGTMPAPRDENEPLQPVAVEVLMALKREDVAAFAPGIVRQPGRWHWRKIVFGTLLYGYDLSIRVIKKLARGARRVMR